MIILDVVPWKNERRMYTTDNEKNFMNSEFIILNYQNDVGVPHIVYSTNIVKK